MKQIYLAENIKSGELIAGLHDPNEDLKWEGSYEFHERFRIVGHTSLTREENAHRLARGPYLFKPGTSRGKDHILNTSDLYPAAYLEKLAREIVEKLDG
jgi:hypothetical protein